MVSWEFLLIGSFGAVGLALAAGTLAAMGHYRRKGFFPSGSPDDPPPTRGHMIGMWLRIVVGSVLAVAGVAALVTRDLL